MGIQIESLPCFQAFVHYLVVCAKARRDYYCVSSRISKRRRFCSFIRTFPPSTTTHSLVHYLTINLDPSKTTNLDWCLVSVKAMMSLNYSLLAWPSSVERLPLFVWFVSFANTGRGDLDGTFHAYKPQHLVPL